MPDLAGRCGCGSVTWSAQAEPLWGAMCHCEDCRRVASSDYVSWLGLPRAAVVWSGPRKCYRSSEKVVRSFCEGCGSPLSFESEVFPDETHVYAVTLNDPGIYVPTAHIFWSERLPWVTVNDTLPKHAKGLQDAAAKGVSLLD